MVSRICMILFIVVGLRPFTASAQENPTRVVIIDTDMAPDDWMAILYTLQRTDLKVAAITVSGTGETHCEPGVQNVLKLLALADYEPIPVACGRETPLQGEHVFPEDWRAHADSLGGLTVPESDQSPANQSAVDLITALIQESPEKVSILTLGPLTNIAEALQQTPALIENLETITIMGGAVDVPGNLLDLTPVKNDVAEWNIYIDPLATQIVFESGAPVTLVPLDVTNQVPMTNEFYELIGDKHTTPEATFVFELLDLFYQAGILEQGWYYFWDPLAAVILSENDLADFEIITLSVVVEDEAFSGQTIRDENGFNIQVAVSVDASAAETLFLNTLNGD